MNATKPTGRILAALVLVLAATCRADAENVPGTGVPLTRITAGLAWHFAVSARPATDDEKNASPASRPADCVAHLFESSGDSGTRAADRPARLQARLTSCAFTAPADARAAYARIAAGADPDMGLSYAWDLLVPHNRYLYRLHAGCVFAQSSFESMGEGLLEAIAGADRASADGMRCRCGGGCEPLTPGAQP